MTPQISLIIVYRNAEATLSRVFESIVRQRGGFKAEYIFVDDASTDGSARLVTEFASTHNRLDIKLLSMPEHSGPSRASQAAIDAAAGEYVMRLDADDMLERDAISTMLKATDGGAADIVVTPFAMVRGNNTEHQRAADIRTELNEMPVDVSHFSMCNKFVRRSLLLGEDMRLFPGIERWEDLGLIARVMARKPRVTIVERPLYYYILDPGRPSLSRSGKELLLRDHIAMARQLEQWFEKQGFAEEYNEFLRRLKFHAKIKYLRGRDKDVKAWKTTFPEVNRSIMRQRTIPLHYRLLFLLAAKLPTPLTQAIARLT